MLAKLKRKFQDLISREAQIAYKIGLSPNTISILGLIFGISSGITYWAAGVLPADLGTLRAYLILALLLLLFSGACDALDGAIARIRGEETAFGGFVDSIIDRYVDSVVLLGLTLGGFCDLVWGVLALVGSLLTSYVRARAESLGVSMESIGLVERAERIMILSISSLVEIIWPSLPALRVGMIVLAVASNFTVFQRILYFYRKSSCAWRKN